MVTELGLIVCFFVGLHFGGGQKTVALHNALSGFGEWYSGLEY